MTTQHRQAYAMGWVASVQDKIADMVPEIPAPKPDPITGLVPLSAFEVYCKERGLTNGKPRKVTARGNGAYNAGSADGRNVSINKGMGARPAARLN